MDKKLYNRQYRLNNKVKIADCKRLWYLRNKDKIRESRKEYFKQYQKKNSERLREYYKQYHQNNIEKIHLYKKKQYQKTKERIKFCVEKHRKNHPNYTKEYYQKNKIRIFERQKEYNQTHRAEINKWSREYHQKNRQYKKTYTALKRGGGSLTIQIVQQIYEDNIKQFNTLTCYLCFKSIQFGSDSIDHKTPLSRGGTNIKENLGVAHLLCNISKGNKTEEEYRIWLTRKEILTYD